MAASPRPARRLRAFIPIPAIAIATLLAGCGSGTKTVSVSSAPLETNTTTSTSTTSSTSSSKTTDTTTSTTSTEAPARTETATASRTSSTPAFVEQEEQRRTGPLASALATVEHAGYLATETSQYRTSQTLRVLIGKKSGTSSEGSSPYTEQAFFFVDGRYIGTDAAKPSAAIALVSQSDTEVVLSYRLFNTSGASAGKAEVHFQLDNGKLEALDPIPPAAPSAKSGGRL